MTVMQMKRCEKPVTAATQATKRREVEGRWVGGVLIQADSRPLVLFRLRATECLNDHMQHQMYAFLFFFPIFFPSCVGKPFIMNRD